MIVLVGNWAEQNWVVKNLCLPLCFCVLSGPQIPAKEEFVND